GFGLLRINAHPLPQAALNISPFFACAFHAPPNGHGAFLFCFAEIVNQTHCVFPPFDPVAHLRTHRLRIYGMQPADHWKLLLVREPAPVEELRLTASLLLVWGRAR